MTPIEFLRQYGIEQRKADRLLAEYNKEREQIDAIKSPLASDGEPHGSGISKKVEDAAVRLADKLLDYEMARLDALETRQIIFDAINAVPGIEGDVLFERYVNLKSWDSVMKSVHCSRRAVFYYHRQGLKKIKVCTLLHLRP